MEIETKMKAKKNILDFTTFEIVQKKRNQTWKHKTSRGTVKKLEDKWYSRFEVKGFYSLQHDKVRT